MPVGEKQMTAMLETIYDDASDVKNTRKFIKTVI